MLSVKEKGILIYICNHCKRIEQKLVGINKEMFDEDDDIKEIICFNIFQIGELAKGLTPEFISKYGNMPWKQIKGMRDVIGHKYGTIDINKVWETATNDIVPLRKYCESILIENQQKKAA